MRRAFCAALICCWAPLGACGGNQGNSARPEASETLAASLPSETPAATPASETQVTGRHCFGYKDETLTLEVVLTFDEEGGVTGLQTGIIEDAKESYYSSYESSISGVRLGNTLTLTLATEIEDDTQEEEATWTWTETSLNDGARVLATEPCR